LGVICFLVHYHNFVLQRIAGGMADGGNQRHCGEFFSVCQYFFSLLRPKLVITARLSVSGVIWLFRLRFVKGKNGFQDFSVSKFFTCCCWSPRVECVKLNVLTVLHLMIPINHCFCVI
jgi:hypothetical protein